MQNNTAATSDEREPEGDFVRVTNTQPRLLHLPDKVDITNKPDVGPRFSGLGTGKQLNPGGNNVDRAEWERAKAHKNGVVKRWVKLKYLVEGGDITEPEGPAAPDDLVSYSESAANLLIEDQSDKKILRRWSAAEERGDVKNAIKKRLQALGK